MICGLKLPGVALLIALCLIVSAPVLAMLDVPVSAAGSGSGSSTASTLPPECGKGLLGLPHWYEYLEFEVVKDDSGNVTDCKIVGPKDSEDNFNWEVAAPRVLVAVTAILLRVAGILAVAFTIYGGFRYILSQGEPDATKKAKGTIVAASVGLVITMFASIIVGFVARVLWQ